MIVAYLNDGDFSVRWGCSMKKDARSAWVRAKAECEIAEISYAKFQEISETHPEFLFALGSQMARRLRATTRKVGDLAFWMSPAASRAPARLMQRARCHDPPRRHAN